MRKSVPLNCEKVILPALPNIEVLRIVFFYIVTAEKHRSPLFFFCLYWEKSVLEFTVRMDYVKFWNISYFMTLLPSIS